MDLFNALSGQNMNMDHFFHAEIPQTSKRTCVIVTLIIFFYQFKLFFNIDLLNYRFFRPSKCSQNNKHASFGRESGSKSRTQGSNIILPCQSEFKVKFNILEFDDFD